MTCTWVGGWGINVRSGKAQGSTTASRKLHDLILGTGEYSIEAWVAPGNVAQEDSRIVCYSGGMTTRNFTLGQTMYNYDFFNRSQHDRPGNGDPKLTTSDDDEDLQATLQHVVATFDPVNGRRIYVNGEFTGDADPSAGGTIAELGRHLRLRARQRGLRRSAVSRACSAWSRSTTAR